MHNTGIFSMGGFTHGDSSLDRWDTGDSIASKATIAVEK
jgi:hypothetical protein